MTNLPSRQSSVEPLTITDACACGHMVLAHSEYDGCTMDGCDCERTYPVCNRPDCFSGALHLPGPACLR